MRTYHVLTIFPHILDSYCNESIIKRAIQKKHITIRMHDIRDAAGDKHKTVDDTPYGGGPGMVMKVEPIYKTLRTKKLFPSKKTSRIILLSPRGKKFDTAMAKRLSSYSQVTFICGRYEAVDERVAAHIADEVVSIGDYVLSGGELAAMSMIEAISRFIPGVIGDMENVIKGDVPQYTKPEKFLLSNGRKKISWNVPSVLLSGDHARIRQWREKYLNKSNP